MAETSAPPAGATPAPKGLVSRFFGVLTSPKETYADVAARPTWLPMFLVIVAISTVCGGWLSTTDVGKKAALDEATRMLESFGARIPPQAYDRMREGIMSAPAWRMYLNACLGSLVMFGVVGAVVAGILLGVFNALMGGDATFKQVFAVTVHAQVILTVKTVFITPLNYMRESMANPTSLAGFLPMLDDTGLPARLLGSIDLFWLWWIFSLAVGVAVLYRRRTQPIATALIGVYVSVAAVIAVALAVLRQSRG